MQRINLSFLLIALTIAAVISPISVTAQARKNTAGTIELELSSQKRDPYLTSQEEALKYFTDLKALLQGVSASNRKLLMPEAEVVNYMGGLYLFCSMKRGVCPAVLEALLEIDIVNSKLSNVSLCPVMKGFWKRYLENDFEDRLKYAISTGFVAKVNEFNSRERPRYLRCEDTLKELFKGGESASALFSKRYQSGSRPLKAIDEVISLINAVSQNGTNVFLATGAQS